MSEETDPSSRHSLPDPRQPVREESFWENLREVGVDDFEKIGTLDTDSTAELVPWAAVIIEHSTAQLSVRAADAIMDRAATLWSRDPQLFPEHQGYIEHHSLRHIMAAGDRREFTEAAYDYMSRYPNRGAADIYDIWQEALTLRRAHETLAAHDILVAEVIPPAIQRFEVQGELAVKYVTWESMVTGVVDYFAPTFQLPDRTRVAVGSPEPEPPADDHLARLKYELSTMLTPAQSEGLMQSMHLVRAWAEGEDPAVTITLGVPSCEALRVVRQESGFTLSFLDEAGQDDAGLLEKFACQGVDRVIEYGRTTAVLEPTANAGEVSELLRDDELGTVCEIFYTANLESLYQILRRATGGRIPPGAIRDALVGEDHHVRAGVSVAFQNNWVAYGIESRTTILEVEDDIPVTHQDESLKLTPPRVEVGLGVKYARLQRAVELLRAAASVNAVSREPRQDDASGQLHMSVEEEKRGRFI